MKLVIPAAIEHKLNAYVQGVDGEIAGMGKLEKRDDGNLYVIDLAIYDQEVTGGTADLSSQALASFQTELIKKGESPKDWYLWWHSHANMSAFFSTIDTGTMESSTEFDHIVSLVVNKRRERKCRLDTHHPFRITIENVPIEVQVRHNPRITALEEQISDLMDKISEIEKEVPEGMEDVAEEIKQKVRVKHFGGGAGFGSSSRGSSNHGTHGSNFFSEEFNDKWSKNRKKSGGVITPEEAIEQRLSRHEIDLLMAHTQSIIRAHVANDNADSPECEEARGELLTWFRLLLALDENHYDDDSNYWNGDEWVEVPDISLYGDDETDPRDYTVSLLAPYQHGDFNTDGDDGE